MQLVMGRLHTSVPSSPYGKVCVCEYVHLETIEEYPSYQNTLCQRPLHKRILHICRIHLA